VGEWGGRTSLDGARVGALGGTTESKGIVTLDMPNGERTTKRNGTGDVNQNKITGGLENLNEVLARRTAFS